MKKLSSKLIFSLKLVVSAVLIGVVVRNVDLGNVLSVVVSVPLWYWFASILLMFLAQAIAAKRWHMVSDHVSYAQLLRLTLTSTVYSFIIPSVLAADAARLVSVPKANDGWSGATARLIVDKLIGLVSVFAIGLPAMMLSSVPQFRQLFYPAATVFGVAAITFAMLTWKNVRRKLRNYLDRTSESNVRLASIARGIFGVLFNPQVQLEPRILAINGLLAMCFQGIMVIMLALSAEVSSVSLTIHDIVVLSTATQLSFFIPLGLGGLGVKEVTQVAVLMTIGVSQQHAVTMASLGYPMVLVMVLIGGVTMLVDRRRNMHADHT